jgi:hypothetical protein
MNQEDDAEVCTAFTLLSNHVYTFYIFFSEQSVFVVAGNGINQCLVRGAVSAAHDGDAAFIASKFAAPSQDIARGVPH